MGEIITPQDIAQESAVDDALQALSKDELIRRFKALIGVNEEALALKDAAESDNGRLRGMLERERRINKNIKRAKKSPKKAERLAFEPWHELVHALDPSHYAKLPLEGRAFILGHIDDVIVIEVPKGTTESERQVFQEGLHRLGMTSAAVIVEEGVRFLKLIPVKDGERQQIEALMKAHGGPEEAPAS